MLDDADQAGGALDIGFSVWLLSHRMRESRTEPHLLSQVNALEFYWTAAQMAAHHSSNGCNLQPGDLFGSGTIFGRDPTSFGSLLELTEGGRKPVALPSGETRRFLEDGDEVIFRAQCRRDGFAPIGFGECRGRVLPAVS